MKQTSEILVGLLVVFILGLAGVSLYLGITRKYNTLIMYGVVFIAGAVGVIVAQALHSIVIFVCTLILVWSTTRRIEYHVTASRPVK